MNIFRRLGLFIENKHLWIVIAGVLLIAAAIVGATRLTQETGTKTFISSSSQTYKDYTRFNQHFSSDTVVVIVTGENITQLLQAKNLEAMANIEGQMSTNLGVLSALSPTSLIKQEQSQSPGTPIENLVVDPQTGQIRPQFKGAFPDDKHAFIRIVLKGDLPSAEQKRAIKDAERAVAAANFQGIKGIVTGTPVLSTQLKDSMSSSLRNMFLVAILLMLVILALIFSVRGFFTWRWLPLGVVVIGIIYTFGAMGILSVPITIVSMAVFPVLIGLGVDYAIQFHNRYDEEARRGKTVADGIIESVTHIGPAIGTAIIAACLGFVALFFSPVPMIRDFGQMLIIGVVVCYLVALFLLLSILYWHDRRSAGGTTVSNTKEKPGTDKVALVERGLRRLAPWVIKSPAIILPIALVATVGGFIADSHIKTETQETKFFSQNLPAMKNILLLEKLAGGFTSGSLLIEAQDVTDPAILAWMAELQQHIKTAYSDDVVSTDSVSDLVLKNSGGVMPQSAQQVKQILAPLSDNTKLNLVSDDYTAANLIINIREIGNAQAKKLNEQLTRDIANHPEGLKVSLTGTTVIRVKTFDALTGGRVKMTLIGVVFIFFGLLLLFRLRLFRTFAAVLPIGLILGWSSGIMFLSGIKYTPLTATLGALILGIGTEFTILLMMRYYEERERGEAPAEAMTAAITKIGRAIIASGFTVIGGFAALLIARDFPVLSDFGIVTMINVLFALISTLVVLPSLIVLLDRWRESRQMKSQL